MIEDKIVFFMVDDQEEYLDLMRQFLEKEGENIQVKTYTYAKDALDALKENECHAIVSDYKMPGMDGIEFLKQIRMQGLDIPFIILTGKGDEKAARDALNLGADRYLEKEDLHNLISKDIINTAKRELEKKEALKALEESERRLSTLMGNLPGMAYRCKNDRYWTMEFVSKGCLELTGHQPKDLINNHKLSFSELIHPDDVRYVQDEVKTAVREGVPFRLTYRIFTKNGRKKWVNEQGCGIPTADGSVKFLEGFITDVTESKTVEKELRESEEKYRNLIERANDGITVIQDGVLKYVNPKLAEMTGYDVDDMIGTPFAIYIAPDELPKVSRNYHQRMAGKGVASIYETVVLDSEGNRLDVELNASVITFGGKPGNFVFVRDISGREEKERTLRESRRFYESMYETTLSLAESDDFKEVMKIIADQATALMAASDCTVYMADYEREVLKPIYSNHKRYSDEIMGYEIPFGKGISGNVFRTGETMYLNFDQEDPYSVHIPGTSQVEDEYESVLSVPMLHREKIIGVLTLNKTDYRFTETDVNKLNIFARQAEVALKKAHGTEKLRASREELRESEKKYRTLIEQASDGMAVIQDAQMKYVNPKLTDMTGYSEEEMIDTNFESYIAPEEVNKVSEIYKKRIADEEAPEIYETVLLKKDGSKLDVELNVSIIPFEGRTSSFVFFRDLSGRKEADRILKDSKKLYESIYETTLSLAQEEDFNKVIRIIADHATSLLQATDCVVYLMNKEGDMLEPIYSNHETSSKEIMSFNIPVGKGVSGKAVETKKATYINYNQQDNLSLHIPGTDPHEEDIESVLSVPMFQEEDVIGVLTIGKFGERFDDEEARKLTIFARQAEVALIKADTVDRLRRSREEIRASRERYKTIFESAYDAIFVMDGEKFIDCNAKTLEIFDCEREDMIDSPPWRFSPAKQPDGRDSKEKALEKINAAFGGEPQVFQWVHAKADGAPFDAEVSLNKFKIGKKSFVMAIVRDITERKEAEDALEEERKRLRFTMEATNTSIDVLDADRNIRYIDSAWRKIYGDPEGRKCYEYFMGLDTPCPNCGIPESIETKEIVVFEQFLPEEERYIEVHTIPYQDKKGEWLVAEFNVDITKRKEAEEELIKTKERYRNWIEHNIVGVGITDLEESITFANERFARMLGYEMDEFIGKNLSELSTEDAYRRMKDKTKNRLKGVSEVYETRLVKKDGGIIDVMVGTTPHKDDEGHIIGTVGFVQDITEKKKAEEELRLHQEHLEELVEKRTTALRESEDYKRSIVELIPDIIIRTNREGEYLEIISTSEKKLIQPREKIIGKKVTDVFPEKEAARIMEHLRKSIDENVLQLVEYEIPIIDKLLWFEARIVPSGNNEAFALIRDITDRKNAERALYEKNEELKAFAYSASHDLRAPLRAIEGFSLALLEDCRESLDENSMDYAKRIVDASERMNILIKDLLAYSRITTKDIKTSTTELDDIMERVTEILEKDIEEAKADINLEKPLPSIKAHDSTVVQIVTNLVSNAIKFVKPGDKPIVTVKGEKEDNTVRLWVEDNGIGIDEKDADNIFDIFERLHGRETYPGTGIGLALVRKGAERMGGKAGVESEPGKGSRFWIELPAG